MSHTLFRRSLGTKLRLAILGTTLVALVLALGATIVYDLRTWHRGWIADVQTQADLLGHASADDLAAGNPRGAQDALATLRLQPRLRNAAVYDAQGHLFAGWHAGGSEAPPATLARADADATAGAPHDLQVRSPIVDQGRTLGTVTVRAHDEIDERIAGYAAMSLGLVLLVLAITWAVSGWLKEIVLRPLATMADIARDAVQHGVSSRRAEDGEELMVAYEELSEKAKELDRVTVRAVYAAIRRAGGAA